MATEAGTGGMGIREDEGLSPLDSASGHGGVGGGDGEGR